MITFIYVTAIALALVAAWFFGLDVHRSEGKVADKAADKLTLKSKDKRAHFVAAAILGFVGAVAGVNPWLAFFVVLAAGGLLEVIQKNPRDRREKGGGYASWKDIVTDALGAIVGVFLGRAFHVLLAYIF